MKHPDPPPVEPYESRHEAAWLPFARLNLMRNPFGQLSSSDQVDVAVVNVEPWLPKLSQSRFALQLLGDCGRGKTTHLRTIQSKFAGSVYVYLPQNKRCPPIPSGQPLLIDEAQRLPWLIRRRVFRRGVPLVLGTHKSLSGALMRAGYSVESVDVSLQVDRALIAEMIRRRIERARLGEGPIPGLDAGQVEYLEQRFGDDLRAIEDHLYARFQVMAGVEGWPAAN